MAEETLEYALSQVLSEILAEDFPDAPNGYIGWCKHLEEIGHRYNDLPKTPLRKKGS